MEYDTEELALREGRRFLFDCGEQTVPPASMFVVVLNAPPVGSSKRLIVGVRRFSTNMPNGAEPVQFSSIVLPPTYPAGTVGLIQKNGVNMLRDAANTKPVSLSVIQGLVTTTRPTGNLGQSGRLPTGGDAFRMQERFMLLPGATVGYFVQAPATLAGLSITTVKVSIAIYGSEEDVMPGQL